MSGYGEKEEIGLAHYYYDSVHENSIEQSYIKNNTVKVYGTVYSDKFVILLKYNDLSTVYPEIMEFESIFHNVEYTYTQHTFDSLDFFHNLYIGRSVYTAETMGTEFNPLWNIRKPFPEHCLDFFLDAKDKITKVSYDLMLYPILPGGAVCIPNYSD